MIAWPILAQTFPGREAPECGAEVLFASEELDFLETFAEQDAGPGPSGLGSGLALAAHLGGSRGRKHVPQPRSLFMWAGYDGLTLATMGHELQECRKAAGQNEHLLRGTTKLVALR